MDIDAIGTPDRSAHGGIHLEDVVSLTEEHVRAPVLGFIGQERVSVLELNLAPEAISDHEGGGAT